ncbi:hypothetical protein, partial [Altererythrobacter sp. Z27]|uniref:hypothetical protein n=1 Tax=Altererythrobacter sp. Z27 TaxID=3461147 RepID=UPI00404469E0
MKSFVAASRGRFPLLAGVALGAVALSGPVFAQDAEVAEDADQVSTESEAILVTGSRIQNVTPFNSPDPIAIVSP